MLRYPVFVFTWWVTGTMAIACYTAAFVWTMEIATGKWKIYLGMSMNYSWPVSRLIIAGLAYSLRDWHWHLRCKSPPFLALSYLPGHKYYCQLGFLFCLPCLKMDRTGRW